MSSKLRYWVKLDSKKVPVGGSNVNRPKKPTSGSWAEIIILNCCGAELTQDLGDVTITDFTFTISCGVEDILSLSFLSTTELITGQQVADYLNNNAGFLGFFSADGQVVTLDMYKKISDAFCDDPDDLSMVIA